MIDSLLLQYLNYSFLSERPFGQLPVTLERESGVKDGQY
jgi:hypothetical protein